VRRDAPGAPRARGGPWPSGLALKQGAVALAGNPDTFTLVV